MPQLQTDTYSNTSHVNVNLNPTLSSYLYSKIQIHLMLMLINKAVIEGIKQSVFKYISC